MMAWARVRGRLGPALGLAAAVVLWAVLPAAAWSAERVALVIGNSAYEHVPDLPNPPKDAADVGAALERLGFAVTSVDDADYNDLRLGLLEFEEAAVRSEIAVVFYAGHGIEVGGENFLVPVEARLATDRAVNREAVPLDWVMGSVKGASTLGLVILDACRNNPFLATMESTDLKRSVNRGLARVEPAGASMLVAYSAKEGTTASDGEPGGNSPYTEALLRYLEEPGLEVGMLFRRVRDAVHAASRKEQLPHVYGSLSGKEVYLASAAAPPPPPDGAKEAFDKAKEVGTVAAFQAVVKRFPDTFEADLAQAEIDKLGESDADPEEEERRLELDREEYRLVQVGLSAAGHDPGPADGRIGSGTREAIRRWQGARGEPETGYLDADGAKALMGLGREHEALRRFTELIGRPFSAEYKTDAEGWTDLHYAALLDLPGVVAALCDAGMDADTRLKSGSAPFSDDLKRKLAALGYEEFKDWEAKGETPLMIATVANARDAAEGLTACGADVNAKDTSDHTPLHNAAWYNAPDVAKLLIDRGADVNVKDKVGLTPLIHAASTNALDIVNLLIDQGVDVNAKGDDGLTPLQYAVLRNAPDVAKLLITQGTDVNATVEITGSTALFFAVVENALGMAKLLLDRGADVNATKNNGTSPLHWAADDNYHDVARLLIQHGADVNATDDDGQTPLDIALDKGHSDIQALLRKAGGMHREQHEAMRRFTELLGRPFSAEYKTDAEGWTDLHYAALLDLPGVVATMCDAGMDADTRLKAEPTRFGDDLKRTLTALGHEKVIKYWRASGITPLMIASFVNARNAAAELVACGADVNAKDDDGETLLHVAAWKRASDVAKLLIDRGADVNAKNDYGSTPLFHPANYDNVDIVKLLIDRGTDVNATDNDGDTPLRLAFVGGAIHVAKLLIDRGADSATPLHAAVFSNQFDLAERLIARGADVNAKTTVGFTPLHLAVSRNSPVIVNLLLDRGADVNATGEKGNTPLHTAADWDSLDMTRLLLDRGADVNATNEWGGTPLATTAVWNYFNVAKLLLDRGADVNAYGAIGTPLDRAVERGSSEMQVLLREAGGVCKYRDC